MTTIGAKIDKLISAELKDRPDQLGQFFERIQSNYDDAIRTASQFFLSMLAAWFLTYVIYQGWIDEIDFLGLKLNRKMIVVSPFLLGLLSYGLLCALAAAVVLWEAISCGILRMLPTAWHLGLDDLLAPPTFSNVERMLEPGRGIKASLFSDAWFALVTALMFGGSLGGLVQTTRFLFDPCLGIHPVLAGLSGFLGAMAWLRGVALFKRAIDATGSGFQLRHHRGSARDRATNAITATCAARETSTQPLEGPQPGSE